MSTIDIRNMQATPVERIRFADDVSARGCFITKKEDHTIALEDADQDGESWPLNSWDVDNFIKARTHARSLGWNI